MATHASGRKGRLAAQPHPGDLRHLRTSQIDEDDAANLPAQNAPVASGSERSTVALSGRLHQRDTDCFWTLSTSAFCAHKSFTFMTQAARRLSACSMAAWLACVLNGSLASSTDRAQRYLCFLGSRRQHSVVSLRAGATAATWCPFSHRHSQVTRVKPPGLCHRQSPLNDHGAQVAAVDLACPAMLPTKIVRLTSVIVINRIAKASSSTHTAISRFRSV